MTETRSDLAVIADIAANIFAVFLLMLIILLDLSRGSLRPAEGGPVPAIDVTRDLHAIERAPVPAGELVEMLRTRNRGETAVIDLFESRIEVRPAGAGPVTVLDGRRDGERRMLDQFEAMVRGRTLGGSAHLFVFSNRWYAPVVERLLGAAVRFREMSVPMALRNPAIAPAGDAWSAGFLALVERSLDTDRFRVALARLLAGSPRSAAELGRSFGAPRGGAPGGPPEAAEGVLDRIRRWLGLATAIIAITLGCGCIVVVERRYPRSIHLAARAASRRP